MNFFKKKKKAESTLVGAAEIEGNLTTNPLFKKNPMKAANKATESKGTEKNAVETSSVETNSAPTPSLTRRRSSALLDPKPASQTSSPASSTQKSPTSPGRAKLRDLRRRLSSHKTLPPLERGAVVFVPDGSVVYRAAVVMNKGEEDVVVDNGEGEPTQHKEWQVLRRQNPMEDESTCSDLTTLVYLHDASVLHAVRSRYLKDKIYTIVGTSFGMLLAVNPYKMLPLYSGDEQRKYVDADLTLMSPHIYTVAETAFRAMRNEGRNQCILISGESGAGKTESSKVVMNYLAVRGTGASKGSVSSQVLSSNPLLEAFGNAKTGRNDNSSRFGKYIEIFFDQDGTVSGGSIKTYLLEKTRVVHQNENERNFHIFFQLIKGATNRQKLQWHLTVPSAFRYLNQVESSTISGVDDEEEFQKTKEAMNVVGLTDDECNSVFQVLAGILHLGNVNFIRPAGSDTTEVLSKDDLNIAAELLGVSVSSLTAALVTKQFKAGNEEQMTIPLTMQQAENSRDSLAKTLYSKVFNWLVSKINASIDKDASSSGVISVLDIYGFESFAVNSFEQFCINYANEQLQQQFLKQVFKKEQKEYQSEQLEWDGVDYGDNSDLLALIEGHLGILSLLDEAAMLQTPSHKDFCNRLYTHHMKHARFEKPRTSTDEFILKHSMGTVQYSAEYFLEKNLDFVVAEHEQVMQGSKVFLVSGFGEVETAGSVGAGSRPSAPTRRRSTFRLNSVGNQFKDSLLQLMERIGQSSAHYIRCIKPNGDKKAGIVDDQLVYHQLKCAAVLESIRISAAGFPSRLKHVDFYERYELLIRPHKAFDIVEEGAVAICTRLLDQGEYQKGRTKMFLRSGQVAFLEDMRDRIMSRAAESIQAMVRMGVTRSQFLELRSCTIVLQRFIRYALARMELIRRRKQKLMAARIQAGIRGFLTRRQYSYVYMMILRLQRSIKAWVFKRKCHSAAVRLRWARGVLLASGKMYLAKQEKSKRKAAVLTLQRAARAYQMRRLYDQHSAAITVIQARARQYLAQRQFSQARASAIKVQCAVRQQQARKCAKTLAQGKMRRYCCAVIQINYRRHFALRISKKESARRHLESCHIAAELFQRAWRRHLAIRAVKKKQIGVLLGLMVDPATRVQTIWRGHKEQEKFNSRRKSAHRLQRIRDLTNRTTPDRPSVVKFSSQTSQQSPLMIPGMGQSPTLTLDMLLAGYDQNMKNEYNNLHGQIVQLKMQLAEKEELLEIESKNREVIRHKLALYVNEVQQLQFSKRGMESELKQIREQLEYEMDRTRFFESRGNISSSIPGNSPEEKRLHSYIEKLTATQQINERKVAEMEGYLAHVLMEQATRIEALENEKTRLRAEVGGLRRHNDIVGSESKEAMRSSEQQSQQMELILRRLLDEQTEKNRELQARVHELEHRPPPAASTPQSSYGNGYDGRASPPVDNGAYMSSSGGRPSMPKPPLPSPRSSVHFAPGFASPQTPGAPQTPARPSHGPEHVGNSVVSPRPGGVPRRPSQTASQTMHVI